MVLIKQKACTGHVGLVFFKISEEIIFTLVKQLKDEVGLRW